MFKQSPSEFLKANKGTNEIPDNIKDIAENRWQAKLNRDWATADNLRQELDNLGYVIKDSKEGYEIIKK